MDVAIRDHDWHRVRVSTEALRRLLVESAPGGEGSASARRLGKDGSSSKAG